MRALWRCYRQARLTFTAHVTLTCLALSVLNLTAMIDIPDKLTQTCLPMSVPKRLTLMWRAKAHRYSLRQSAFVFNHGRGYDVALSDCRPWFSPKHEIFHFSSVFTN
jgi:hypothetical protein